MREDELDEAVVVAAAEEVDVVLGVTTTLVELVVLGVTAALVKLMVGVTIMLVELAVLVAWTITTEVSSTDRTEDVAGTMDVASVVGCCDLCLPLPHFLDRAPLANRRAARAGRVEKCIVTRSDVRELSTVVPWRWV